MSGHTPGPWILTQHTGKEYGKPDLCSHAVMGANELQIATVVSDCVDGFEANARLIAAAPELLAALKSALQTAQFEGHPFRGWHKEASDAIAKATGAQP